MLERVPKYTLRKLSVGLASVMIGSGILMNSPKVLADTNDTSTAVKSSSQIEDKSGKLVTEAATTTNAEAGATNPQDSTQGKGEQTNTSETTQNTANGNKKDAEVTPDTQKTTAKFKVLAARPVMKVAGTAETPDPTVPDKSANAAIINNQDELANDWMQLKQGKLKLYLTVRGLDNKTYVSSYADAQKKIKSMIISNRLDPNSLEVHVDFENTDVKKNIATLFGWDTKVMQIDTSRLGTDGIVAHGKSGKTYQIGLNHDGGNYDSYERMVKMGKDISKVGAFYM
ncbi:MAG: YSIRK-type signal peptide-containing protein, partial [Lactobacillus crispatus]|nr:YSIRK-type signal peptide-containing protein [Lactobacillus crispatus]